MPELPIPAQLGQRSFQDRSQVVRPQVDTSGQERLVDTLQQVSSNINERLDRSSLQKAKIEYQRAKIEADNAFDQDQDFATHEQRYNEMLGKAAESSSKLIRNPRMQDQFKEEISLYQAEGAINIKKKAFAKEVERGIADLDGKLVMARENYLRSTNPVDRNFSRENMMEAIDFAQESGYIDETQAGSLRQKTAVDLAIASIKIEPASKQVQLLKENQGLIDVIPKDVRLQMIKEAEGQSSTNAALSYANSISAAGGDLGSRLKSADKISDVKVREMTKQQIEEDFGREKRAKSELQYNAYDSLKTQVLGGKTAIEVRDSNPEAWRAMSADQEESILSMGANKRDKSDLAIYNKINQMAGQNKDHAYQFWLDNVDKLSSSDNKQISDRFAKPEELNGFLERAGRLDVALGKIDVKDKNSKNYELAQQQLDKDFIAFEKAKGRKPDAEELDKLIVGITDKVVDGSWNPFVADEYGFNRTQDQRAAKAKIVKFDQKIAELKKTLSDSGKDATISAEEETALYKKWDAKGALND